jgi:sugar phosphate isomerase/epimerase
MAAFESFSLRLVGGGGGDVRGALAVAGGAKAGSGLHYPAVALDIVSRELDLLALPESGLRDLRSVAARNALKIAALWLDLPTVYLGPRCDLDQLLSIVRRSVVAARGLGAGVVVVQLGLVPTLPSSVSGTGISARAAAIDQQLAGAGFGLVLPTAEDVARLVQRPRPTGAAAAPPAASTPELASLGPSAMTELAAIADHHRITVAVAAAQSPCMDLAAAVAGAKCRWLVPAADTLAVTADGVPPDEFFGKAGGGGSECGPVIVVRDGLIGPGGRVQEAPVGSGGVDWPAWVNAIAGLPRAVAAIHDPSGLADRMAGAARALSEMRKLGLVL